jgi:hypothetical protein
MAPSLAEEVYPESEKLETPRLSEDWTAARVSWSDWSKRTSSSVIAFICACMVSIFLVVFFEAQPLNAIKPTITANIVNRVAFPIVFLLLLCVLV